MRDKTNITIAIANELAHQARIEAARRNVSLSTLGAESLAKLVQRNKQRKRALVEASKFLGRAFVPDEAPLDREEIYRDRVR